MTAPAAFSSPEPADHAMVLLLSSQVLRAALRLGLPDAVGQDDAVVPAAELAARTGTDPATLLRLLRALAGLGVFRLGGPGADEVSHTPVSACLRSGDHGAVLGQSVVVDELWDGWSALDEGVRTGECAFSRVHGTDFYSHLAEHDPEASEAFHAAMTESTEHTNDDLLAALDLTSARTVVDVGGGRGGLLRDILAKHQHLHGVLLDTPDVVADALPELRRGGELARRCTVLDGDARYCVPSGADVYLLRLVLHNWDDDGAERILRSCAAAVTTPHARVVVVEALCDDGPYAALAGLIDLGMFVTFGGRERSRADYEALFARAGLRLTGITPTPSLHLIEARRAE
ncbi:MAG TPA: methyltransferase [Pseudonocardiaceae bacterium]